jgi:DNA adenine methylase
VAQWLISLMPCHRVYCEPFLGRGVILNTKRPAAVNIGIDCDAGIIDDYRDRHPKTKATIVHGDALQLLPVLKVEPDWFIYVDPPYLGETRSCQRRYYGRELYTRNEHEALLSILTGLSGMVMISGYWSQLYSITLTGWRTSSFWTVNRGGKRVQEFVWMNYAAGLPLHDPRFVGNNFTDRQRVKRKIARWRSKLMAMDDHERQALLDSFSTVPTFTQKNGYAPGCKVNSDNSSSQSQFRL